jgi:hypothetical protein
MLIGDLVTEHMGVGSTALAVASPDDEVDDDELPLLALFELPQAAMSTAAKHSPTAGVSLRTSPPCW